jgi:alcohol dehydrogenase class IV
MTYTEQLRAFASYDLTMKELQTKVGCSHALAYLVVQREGLPYSRVYASIMPSTCATARKMYEAGRTWDDIGFAIGVDHSQVGKLVRRAGGELRRGKGWHPS